MLRSLALIALVITLNGSLILGASAQEATSAEGEPSFTMAGMSDLQITLSSSEIVVPAEIPAGRVRVTLTNTDAEDVNSIMLVRLSDDVRLSDLRPAAGTPTADAGPPAWLYRATLAGGPAAIPGSTGVAVVDLSPGEWAVVSYPELTARPPHRFVVGATGASTPAASDEPLTDITVTENDFSFALSAATVPAGLRNWTIVNEGGQPHEFAILRFPVPLTAEQFLTLLSLPADATPLADLGFNPEDVVFVGGVSALSSAQTLWATFDLEAGYYLLVCFLNDPMSGTSHIEMGMAEPFTVA